MSTLRIWTVIHLFTWQLLRAALMLSNTFFHCQTSMIQYLMPTGNSPWSFPRTRILLSLCNTNGPSLSNEQRRICAACSATGILLAWRIFWLIILVQQSYWISMVLIRKLGTRFSMNLSAKKILKCVIGS